MGRKWIAYNLGLKIIALILAIVTWLYVSGELNKQRTSERKAGISFKR